MSEKFDKAVLFKWLHKGASTIQRGVEVGIQKGQELSEAAQARIEASPRARSARDFVIRQGERLQDVRIGHTRVGDIPNAAQRLAERQFFKILNKMRKMDPDFNWDAYLPNPDDLPIFEAFDCLGLPYGAPWPTVRKRYLKLMREYHPDRHADSPESEQKATEKTQEIAVAYELIQEHYGK